MRLNLGCGQDYREGYDNIDLVLPCDECIDLSELPWPWHDGEADEILMLDFLEHFPYAKTDLILQECWRVLATDGFVDIQVPDFEHCALAALRNVRTYMCNVCPSEMLAEDNCPKCGTDALDIAQAAIHRLYGGQNVEGNWHYTAFTKNILGRKLLNTGFERIETLEHAHQRANWNFKLRAFKSDNPWSE